MTTPEAILLMTNAVAIFLWIRKDVIDEKNLKTYIQNEELLERKVARLNDQIISQKERYESGIVEVWEEYLKTIETK